MYSTNTRVSQNDGTLSFVCSHEIIPKKQCELWAFNLRVLVEYE